MWNGKNMRALSWRKIISCRNLGNRVADLDPEPDPVGSEAGSRKFSPDQDPIGSLAM